MLGQAVQADSSPVKTPQESTHFADGDTILFLVQGYYDPSVHVTHHI